MASLSLILHVAAIVCWGLAGFGISVPKVELVALGLFLWFLPAVVAV